MLDKRKIVLLLLVGIAYVTISVSGVSAQSQSSAFYYDDNIEHIEATDLTIDWAATWLLDLYPWALSNVDSVLHVKTKDGSKEEYSLTLMNSTGIHIMPSAVSAAVSYIASYRQWKVSKAMGFDGAVWGAPGELVYFFEIPIGSSYLPGARVPSFLVNELSSGWRVTGIPPNVPPAQLQKHIRNPEMIRETGELGLFVTEHGRILREVVNYRDMISDSLFASHVFDFLYTREPGGEYGPTEYPSRILLKMWEYGTEAPLNIRAKPNRPGEYGVTFEYAVNMHTPNPPVNRWIVDHVWVRELPETKVIDVLPYDLREEYSAVEVYITFPKNARNSRFASRPDVKSSKDRILWQLTAQY